jgi:hypothetical protein
MMESTVNIELALKDLVSKDESALYAELGLRTIVLRHHPKLGNSFSPRISIDNFPKPPKAELRKLGKQILNDWNRSLYSFVCEDKGDDHDTKDKILKAISLGGVTSASIITSVLISIGLAPALAIIVGTLIMRLFVVPAGQTICNWWKGQLALSH